MMFAKTCVKCVDNYFKCGFTAPKSLIAVTCTIIISILVNLLFLKTVPYMKEQEQGLSIVSVITVIWGMAPFS